MSLRDIIRAAVPEFESMTPDDRERFAGMCGLLAASIIDGKKAVWMIDTDERLTLMSVNCNEFEMAQLVSEGYHSLNCSIMEEAPPKEEMN